MFERNNLSDNVEKGSFLSDLNSLINVFENIKTHHRHEIITTEHIVLISNLENQISKYKDIIFNKYNCGDYWAKDYLSGKAAILHETHRGYFGIKKSIERGKLISQYENIDQALNDNFINTDHIDLLCKINSEKYKEYFERDIDLLVEKAIQLNPKQFSYVLSHWKSIVDDNLENHDDIKLYNERHLEISQQFDGSWYLNGVLDNTTGTIVHNALNSGADSLWLNDSEDARNNTSKSKYRSDVLGHIFSGFVNKSINAQKTNSDFTFFEYSYTPSITADLIIDLEQLQKNRSTREYLQNTIVTSQQFRRAHSKRYIEQILCDCTLDIAIKNIDGKYHLGKTRRIASHKQKRLLALKNNTCSIKGCTIPANYCDAHHKKHWIHGGETTPENLMLLCHRHHTLIHNDELFASKAIKYIYDEQKLDLDST